MVGDRFSMLLEELGKVMNLKLAPDKNNACLFKFPDGLQVRLDPDRLGDSIYIWSDLGPLPQGKYRENVFLEALKSNGLPPPRAAIFAYNPKKESLLLYDQVTITDVTPIRLNEIIQTFAEKARIWKEGITRGEVPSFQATGGAARGAKGGGSGIFGLR